MKSMKLIVLFIVFLSMIMTQNSFGSGILDHWGGVLDGNVKKITKTLSSDKELEKAFNFNKDKIVKDWHRTYHSAVPDKNLRNAINFAATLAYPNAAAAEYTLVQISKFHKGVEDAARSNGCKRNDSSEKINEIAINKIAATSASVTDDSSKKKVDDANKSYVKCFCTSGTKEEAKKCLRSLKTKLEEIEEDLL